jgi:DNA-binding XRE family transcriptional regulator
MSGFIYAIAAGEVVKIGYSRDPQKRFAKLKTDNSTPCHLIGFVAGTLVEEKELHRKFKPWRVYREWFHNTGPVHEFCAAIRLPLAPTQKRGRRPTTKPSNPLHYWTLAEDLTDAELALAVGRERSTITKIRLGQAMPSLELALSLEKVSRGAVPANSYKRIKSQQSGIAALAD